ncbi:MULTISPECIES: IclR family transcriptional regulator [Bradyrhizobium]|jgi:IclR family transcriptional regulator, acetate operon repressor|uniref:IclR family acetate operon transcriptional repressor n=1 Tax=Bradyrhizobium ottawaense TaxID=931866 RepID=A0ABV4FZ55_9BRAD|nr:MULTISPECIES: IclR family transcriptional regulator C-terminal domain-containing protein [Bradyrhizobium]MBR1289725.1 helix-turn-helix domain-containing protein [Bradyrhizobium ottawaense]MDA9418089.1 transcriptional regulator [Bradyrhizobium sp. CCBAU 25360]MDA9484822.1 transcriptional regulator [Bradyrhizobium sp. CCBAU 11445]PDT68435.1 transcriptional regulator [Bradyrhizobium ottawaense]WLB48792.1 IclR family transcriptional regulator C-terminal domain-containing protein [Bradyrhizobium
MSKNVIRRKSLEPRSSEADNDTRDGGVQSVDRALSILETLAEDDEGYRLSDLAVRTGLSASTVHRLLATLESRRFVQFDRTQSKWHVGSRAFTVGASFARRRNFSAQAIPYLRKLRDLTRETANLAVVDDEFIIVLTRMESREIMRSLTLVGGRVPMVTSGVGKAVLATYSDEDVGAVIRHHGMPRLTEKSIVRPSDLFKELEKIRKQGFALDDEEASMGLRCIAAVVYNDCAEPLAAISVSGMTSRLTDDRLPEIGQIVREVAGELTIALGGVMPAPR